MPLDLVVRGGEVATDRGLIRCDLGISGGRVAALAADLPAGRDEIDATGLVVLPGLVDPHVHLREPGMTDKEDFSTGTRSAAVGGITTVFDMPNTRPPVETAERFARKLAAVAPKAHTDFGLYGMISQTNLEEIPKLASAGAMGLKLFMGQTTGDNPCPDDGAIFAGLRAAAACGLVVGAHAENDSLLRRLARELQAAGRNDPRAHLESRPEVVEVEAVTRLLNLAAAAGATVHIHHVSTAAGVDRARRARRRGQPVTLEVLVAHLLLDEDAYERYGNLIKLNPPIRPRADVDALWRALTRGDIDVIATDHAPHTESEQGEPDVWKAPGGFIGVETMLPLLLTEVAKSRLSLPRLVAACCRRPAEIWGLGARKGHLGVGADGDFVLVDLTATGVINAGDLHSKHRVTPYDGWPVQGLPKATYLRGRLIAADGEPVGPPAGRALAPGYRAPGL